MGRPATPLPSRIDTIGDGYRWDGRPYKIGSGGPASHIPETPFPVFGACAGAGLYRRRMLDEIGLFDERYFAYMEDVDLAIRARLAGWTCICVPKAVVLHAGAGSSGGFASDFSVRLTTKNVYATILKTIPAPLTPFVLVASVATLSGGMLTARTAEADRVAGLDLGADDYVTKPFSLRELAARVRAVLRRHHQGTGGAAKIYRGAHLQADFDAVAVQVDGTPVRLTRREFELLRFLIENRNRVLSRDRLLERVWGYERFVETRSVDVHIGRLRAKLGAAGQQIETVVGLGYRFVD